MSLNWVTLQIMARANPELVRHHKPSRAGVLQEGGAAKAVLAFLQAHPKQFFTFAQIMAHTGRTAKALDWACIYLRSLGYVECGRDDGRNSRYLRYKYANKAVK